MPILFKCPCGKTLKAPDRLKGKAIKCPACSAAIRVPDPSKRKRPADEAPPPPAPAPPPPQEAQPAPELESPALEDAPLEFDLEPDAGQPPADAQEEAPAPPKPDGGDELDFPGLDAPLEFGLEPDSEQPPAPAPEEHPAPDEGADEGGLDLGFALEEDEPSPPAPAAEEADAPMQLDMEAGGLELDSEPATPPEKPEPDLADGVQPSIEDTEEAFDLPDDLGAGQEASGDMCPNCNAPLPGAAILCVNCGQRLDEAPKPSAEIADDEEEEVAKPPPPRAASGGPGGSNQMVVIGVAAGVIVIALAGMVLWLLMRSRSRPEPVARRPEPTESAEPRERPERPAPRERAEPRPEPRAPTPAPAVAWSQFASPALQRRDSARRLAEAIAAYREAHDGSAPPGFAEMNLEGELARIAEHYAYVGAAPGDANRQTVLAHEKEAGNGVRWAVLSDGTVRALGEAEIEALRMHDSEHGRLTAAEIAVLASLGPGIKVVNERFASLGVLIDGEEVAVLEQHTSAVLPVGEGVQRVAFRADGADSREILVLCSPAMLAELGFRRHATRPIVPEADIRRAAIRAPGRRDPRQVIDAERRLAALRMGEYDVYMTGDESVRVVSTRTVAEGNFCRGIHGRIDLDGRHIAGVLPGRPLGETVHDERSIADPAREPILVNAIGRLAEGDVFYPCGAVEQYRVLDTERETRFGTVCATVTPNPALARFVRLPDLPEAAGRRLGEDPYDEDDEFRPGLRRVGRRPAPRPGESAPLARPGALPQPLDFSWPEIGERMDLAAVREPLARLGRPAADALLALATRAAEAPERPEPNAPRRRAPAWEAFEDDLEPPAGPIRRQPDEQPTTFGRERPAAYMPSPEEALAMAGAYGAPRLAALLPALEGRPPMRRAAAFALGLTGEEIQAATLAGIGRRDRVAALLGLVALDMPQAAAVRLLATAASAEEWIEFMRSAPAGVGPAARSRLIAALREAQSPHLRRRDVLEVLCAFVPGATAEEALFAVLEEPPLEAAPAAPRPQRRDDPDEDPDDYDEPDEPRRRVTERPADPLAEVRRWAARMLVHLGHRPALMKMLADLQGGTPEARATAVFALREAPDPSLAGPLARGLELPDAAARAAAADALLAMGDGEALESVRARLEGQGDVAFRLVLDAAEGIRDGMGGQAAAQLLASLWRATLKAATPAPAPERRRDPDDPYDEDDDYAPPPRRSAPRRGPAPDGLQPTPEAEGPLAAVGPQDVLAEAQRLGAFDRELFDAVAEGVAHPSAHVKSLALSHLPQVLALAPEAEREALASLAEEKVLPLLQDKETAVAASAAGALARLAVMRDAVPEMDLAPVQEGLASGDAERIMSALQLASGFGENEALQALLANVLYSYIGQADDPQANAILAKLAEAMGSAGGAASAPMLLQLLPHPDRSVRLAAVHALGNVGDVRSARTLADLVRDPDSAVQRAAVLNLARIPGGAGIPHLAAFLREGAPARRADRYEEEEPRLRRGRRVPRPMPDMEEAPEDDLRSTVIAYALRHGTRRSFRGLASGIAKSDVQGLRQVVQMAEDILGEASRAEYVRFLGGYLDSGSVEARALAAGTLEKILSPDALLALLAEPAAKHPEGILPAAARAAAETGDAAWIDKLQDWYPNTPIAPEAPDQASRRDMEVIDAARRTRTRAPAPAPSATDIAVESRVETLLAIGRLGGSEAVLALRQLLGRKINANMRRIRMTDSRGREIPGPSPEDAEVLRALVRAYALTNAPEAVSAIVARDAGYDNLLRPEVVEALGECGHLDPENARRTLFEALRDPDPDIAAAAADAMDDMRNRGGV